jgi:hypothetical protein
MEFMYLKQGQPLEQMHVRQAVFKATATHIIKALCFKVAGAYGVAMPNRNTTTRRRPVFCPPWMLPFWVETDMANPDIIGIDTDWMVGCLGKDYDGDLLMVLEPSHMLKRLNLDASIFPDWNKPEDQAWAKQWLKLPEKLKGTDPRSVHDVMVDGLKGYGLIGRVTNMCMVVLDAIRASGTTDRRTLMGIYLKMMSTEVQQFVDSIKYTPGGLWAPRLEDYKTKNGRVIPGMASRYGVDIGLVLRVQDYFRAVRRMDFDLLSKLPEDKELSGSFYYKIASLLKGWTPVQSVSMAEVGELVATTMGLPTKCKADMLRRQSYMKYKGDMEARINHVRPVLTTPELTIGLAARAWAHNDYVFALELEKLAGKRVLDVYKPIAEARKIQVPVQPVTEPDCDSTMQDC